MRKILSSILVLTLFASCNQTGSVKEKASSDKTLNVAAIKTIELRVTGMTCEGCENTVKEAVNKVEGVKTTQASYTAELTTISYDTTLTNPEKLAAVINDLGYKVEGPAANKKE